MATYKSLLHFDEIVNNEGMILKYGIIFEELGLFKDEGYPLDIAITRLFIDIRISAREWVGLNGTGASADLLRPRIAADHQSVMRAS